MKSFKIKSIKKIGIRKTYDISVDDNHNFLLGNMILSHNSYGRIGGGKSVSTLSIIQGFHDNYGYKILDLFGGERNEGLFWALPSTDDKYWMKLGAIGKFDEPGPKQYKVNLLYPYFGTKLPKKLPKKLPYVNSKVFTIPLLSLIPEDVSMVIGSTSETSKYELQELLHVCNKKTNVSSLNDIIETKKMKALKNTLFYKNFLLPLIRNEFIADSYCDYNLDLINEMKDRETVSVLCLDFVPEQFHIFIINYLLRNIMDLIDLNKIPKKNIGFIREAATFFRATEDSVLDDKFKIFRTLLAHYIRMGRRGFFLALDCQSASETRGLVEGSSDYVLMFKTTSWRDKAEMTDELKREKRMRQDQVADLGFLEPGQAYIAEISRNVRKIQIVKPRTMYWERSYGNFYRNLWERFGGEWSSTGEVKDYIEMKSKNIMTGMKTEIKQEVTTASGEEVKTTPEAETSIPELGENFKLPDEAETKTPEINPIEVLKEVKIKKKKKVNVEKEIEVSDALSKFNQMVSAR